MSTPAHRSLLSRFQHVQWAFRGLSEVLNPDQVLDSHERANLSALLGVLSAELERIMHDAMHRAELLAYSTDFCHPVHGNVAT